MAVAYNPSIVTNGLVLALDAGNTKSYPGSGTTWTDLTGRGNNGTLVNMDGANFNSANGGSLTFDGINEYVNAGATSQQQLLANNQFTINYWIRITGTARVDFFNIKNFNVPADDMGFFIDTDNKLYAFFNVQGVISNNSILGGRTSVSNTTFARNTYYNICCMKDSSQKIVMYVNGVLDNDTYSSTTNTSSVSSTDLWIGSNRSNATTTASVLTGNIAQVSFYNRALSAAEVQQNFNALRGRFGI